MNIKQLNFYPKASLWILLVILLGVFQYAYARPISYPGGWTIMQLNDSEKNRLHIHYSPSFATSLGVVIERNPTDVFFAENVIAAALQWNQLLLRYNTFISQLNIYSKARVGGVFLVENFNDSIFSAQPNGITSLPEVRLALSSDAETRRFYGRYAVEAISFLQSVRPVLFSQELALGVAPYVADYGALHTWIIFQANYEHTKNQLELTPVIRMFYSVFLWEVGYSFTGKLLFNLIVRL